MRKLPRWLPPSVRILHFAFRHRKMIEGRDFDVVLGFGNTLTMNVYQSHGGVHYLSSMRKLNAIRSPVRRQLKMLALFLTPKFHVRGWIESAAFRMNQPPVIIAISDMVRDDMAQHFQLDQDQIRLVYNGIETTRFSVAANGSRDEFRRGLVVDREVLFLYMAYDFRKKGAGNLVEAASILRKRVGSGRFRVAIVGGSPSSRLAGLVRRLDLDGLVSFHGPTTEPEAWYKASDVFILPTFYDACSLVVFEAMASGLPAITTVFNGASGIITDGVDGVVLQDPGNIDEMASAMERFLHPDALESASKAARRTAMLHTLERNHASLIEIFSEVARKGMPVLSDKEPT
ncbi:MAG: glycosyltransferase family 4 protein [Deltaproteobacteria bacterium]